MAGANINKETRETLDTIYELTSGDGYKGSLKDAGKNSREICQILVQDGVLIKTGPNTRPHYKWNEVLYAPTDVFVRKIDNKLSGYWKERNMTFRERQKQKKFRKMRGLSKLV